MLAASLALAGCDQGRPDAAAPPAPLPKRALDAPSGPAAVPQRAAADRAPTRFLAGATAPVETLAQDIARGLSTDARVLDCAEGVVDGRSAFAPAWVVAHRVDVDGDGPDDWLVEGRHRCLAGPDGADWWLYADSAGGRRLLLAAGRARAVEVLPHRSQGFHDLRLWRERGDDGRARYDGAAYVLSDIPD